MTERGHSQQEPSAAKVPLALDTAGQDVPAVPVPMAKEDFDFARRRLAARVALVSAAVLLLGAIFYSRSVNPVRAQEAFDHGERLVRLGRYEQAIPSFDQAVARKRDFAMAYALRGRTYMALSKPLEAIPDFTRLIGLRPRNAEGFLDRGAAYLELEQDDRALADFNYAVKLDPNLARAHNLRGVALRRKNDIPGALEAFERAVQLSPEMNNLYERAATLQILDRHERAISDLTKVLEFDPYNPQGYFARARSLEAVGKRTAARRDRRYGKLYDGR